MDWEEYNTSVLRI